MSIAYPPPTGDRLTPSQRKTLQQIEGVLAAEEYDQRRIQPHLPALAEAMMSACATDDDQGRMVEELDRTVRWHRLPGYYLSFVFQIAMQQAQSPTYITACVLYADAQINANSDLLLNSLENAHKTLARWLAQNGPGEEESATSLTAVAGELRRRLHLVYSYYRHWYTGQSSQNINPLTEHLYSEKTHGDLAMVFPALNIPTAQLTPGDYLGVIAQCDTSGDTYCWIVARRFLGSLYHGQGDVEAASEQFRLGLEEALQVGLDTEIGHLHRLYGYALSTMGHQDIAAQQFQLAYKHEAPVEYVYWRALSARELGDTRLKSCPASIDLDHPPAELRAAVSAYQGGRMEFEANLGSGAVPVARAVGQQFFRSYSDNAIQAAMALGSMPDVLAEWEASGPRYATEVVAESRAATVLAPDVQVQFWRARALFHAHLGAFSTAGDLEHDFADYLASVEQSSEARHLYTQMRVALTGPITHAQLSDEIAAKILALRLPGVVFALLHIGAAKTSVTILDAGSGQMATAESPMGEADWQPIHAAYQEALRESHGLPDPASALRPALDDLLGAYQQMLAPALEPFLPFLHGRHLKIFPRLLMNEVPFHALTVGGVLLADHCASVSYAQTLGLFLQVHRPEPIVSPRTLMMLHDTSGAPIYAGTIQTLTPLLGDAMSVLPDPAWPTVLPALLAKCPTDLFFACHGEYDADDPAASRLLLGGDNGVSFHTLFADLDLSACDCVTLGACESGLGRTLVTAEYLGLPTAFFAAGVRYVIGSLWKVNQLTAAILLGHHYRLLHDGTHTVPTALAEAQRLVRQMSRDDVCAWLQASLPQKAAAWEVLIRRMDDVPFAHPYYWAGFYVAGDV